MRASSAAWSVHSAAACSAPGVVRAAPMVEPPFSAAVRRAVFLPPGLLAATSAVIPVTLACTYDAAVSARSGGTGTARRGRVAWGCGGVQALTYAAGRSATPASAGGP